MTGIQVFYLILIKVHNIIILILSYFTDRKLGHINLFRKYISIYCSVTNYHKVSSLE